MKNTILHLIHTGGFYGAEAVILNLCIGMKETEYRPVIGCFVNRGSRKPQLGLIAESKGIHVRYVPFKNKVDVSVVKKLHKIIDEENICLVNSHGYKPSFYCLIMRIFYRIPFVVTSHLWTKETLRAHLYVFVDKISMLFAEKIIAVSHPIARKISSWKPHVKKISVINNGIDINKYSEYASNFNAITLRKELGLKIHSRVVGTLGRLAYQKAHEDLIHVAENILREKNDVEFLIAGEGHRLSYLKDLTEKFGISDNFHFIGFRSDPMNILKLLDVFVLCSVDEGLPIVLLEAMSIGVPVLVTDVGEIPMIIQNGVNGILVKKKDTHAMAQGIKCLLEDNPFSKELAKNAKNTVESHFTISEMTNKYIICYRNILEKRNLG